MVLDQVADRQVFIGNQVVRCDQRVCRLASKIFALPLDFEMRFAQGLSRPGAIGRPLCGARETTMQRLEPSLGGAQVTGMSHRASLAIGEKRLETQINPDLLAGWHMRDLPGGRHHKLTIIAISTPKESHAFDLLEGKGLDTLSPVADQAQSPDAAAGCSVAGTGVPVKPFLLEYFSRRCSSLSFPRSKKGTAFHPPLAKTGAFKPASL